MFSRIMIGQSRVGGSLAAAFVCSLISGNLAFGGLSACGSGNAANLGAAVVGGITGTGAALNTPPHGCGEVDLGFSNFTVTTTGGDLGGPTAATIAPTTNTVVPSGNTIAPIDVVFSAAWNTGSRHALRTLDSGINYAVGANTTGSSNEPPMGEWAINGLTAPSISGAATTQTGGGIPTGAGAPTIVIIETACLGASNAAGCVASGSTANEATIRITETYNGNGITSSFAAASFAASCASVAASFDCVANNAAGTVAFRNVFSIFVEDAVAINHPADTVDGAKYSIGFTAFTDPFAQDAVPEPATFTLLGIGLAAAGLLPLRGRRRNLIGEDAA
jgi:PEP-CTERM motif